MWSFAKLGASARARRQNPQPTSRQPIPSTPTPSRSRVFWTVLCAPVAMFNALCACTSGRGAYSIQHAACARMPPTPPNASPLHPSCSSLTLEPPPGGNMTNAAKCATPHACGGEYCVPIHPPHSRMWLRFVAGELHVREAPTIKLAALTCSSVDESGVGCAAKPPRPRGPSRRGRLDEV